MGRKNRIVHVEWHSRDAARLQAFYGAVFDWKFKSPMPGYTLIDTGSKELGAGIASIQPERPMDPGTVSYVTVTSLSEAEEKVRDAGGKVLQSALPVEGWGTMSLCLDPDGNRLGLWLPQKAGEKQEKKAKKAAEKQKKAAEKQKKAAKKQKKAAEKQKKDSQDAAKKAKKKDKKADKAKQKSDERQRPA